MTEHCPMCGTLVVPEPPDTKAAMRRILDAVSEASGISVEAIRGPRRHQETAFARFLVCYMIRDMCGGQSFPAIGRLLNNRDHTTIMHAARRGDELIHSHYDVQRWYEKALERLGLP